MHNFCSPSSAESHPPTPCYRPQTAKLNISAKLEEKKKKASSCWELLWILAFPSVKSTHVQLSNKIALQEQLWEPGCKKLELTTQFWTNFVNQGERGVDNVLQKCFILLE